MTLRWLAAGVSAIALVAMSGAPLRAEDSDALLSQAIDEAISRKPKGHDFIIDRRTRQPAVSRHMSVTGG